jgi:endonuclease-3
LGRKAGKYDLSCCPPKPERVRAVLEMLEELYPDAGCSLNHESAYQLLVATILSAQCTDERVNKVTPGFFKRFPEPASLAEGDPQEVEELIRSTGFFRNKAKSLLGMAQAVAKRHEGEIPADLKALVKLPGVGRKTANVVLGNVFEVPGVVVDTHVGRLSNRLGLVDVKDPVKAEYALMEILPKKVWTKFGHQMIQHGRLVCASRKPKCEICKLLDLCPYGQEISKEG